MNRRWMLSRTYSKISMMNLSRHFITYLVVLLLCMSCAKPRGSPDAIADIKPGQRPALDSVEAGLWMYMDEIEENLRDSGRLVRDEAVNTYVRNIVCRLAGPYCSDIRVYVVRTPHFNASMAPNGMMEVWTGLILRAQNEAQLAYVLGHEIGHFLRRHSIQMWDDVTLKADILMYVSLLSAAAGQGYIGNLAQVAAYGSILAFSRDNEREADELGFELMVKAGYDPHEAAIIWEGLIDERKAADSKEPFIFFSTHPPTAERIATLKQLAQEATVNGKALTTGEERFLTTTRQLRTTMLRDELRQREFARSQVVLNRLFETGVGMGELHFFQGELYRKRDQDGDRDKAITEYQAALHYEDAPSAIHRRLGLLLNKAGQTELAKESYEQYLEVHPQAEDLDMIRSILRQLQ